MAQKGSAMLIKVHDGADPGEFVTAAGLRTKTVTLNAEQVDTTNADSANKWRELLEGAGIKTATLSGSGVFKDAASDETIRGLFFNGTIRDYQVVIPNFGTLEGPFQVASLEYAGEHNAEVTWTMTLESAGEIEFTAA